MAEYIEREALRDRMESVDWFRVNDSGVLVHGATSEMESYLPTKEVYRVIDEAPAADVAPVVRCAKCRHWDKARHVCNSGKNYIYYMTKPDFFCAAGEKMDLEGGDG